MTCRSSSIIVKRFNCCQSMTLFLTKDVLPVLSVSCVYSEVQM